MKNIISFAVVCLMLITATLPVFSAEGSAMIPHYQAYKLSSPQEDWHTHWYISNITDSSLTVTITLYDQSGNIITDDNSSSTGLIQALNVTNYSDNNTGSTVSFNIGADSAGYVSIHSQTSGSWKYGYGIIEWSQGTNNKKYQALIVHSRCTRLKVNGSLVYESAYGIPINNGQPF